MDTLITTIGFGALGSFVIVMAYVLSKQLNSSIQEVEEQPIISEELEVLRQARVTIAMLKRSMLVHPDCEANSEFDDLTSHAQEMEDRIEMVLNKQVQKGE